MKLQYIITQTKLAVCVTGEHLEDYKYLFPSIHSAQLQHLFKQRE